MCGDTRIQGNPCIQESARNLRSKAGPEGPRVIQGFQSAENPLAALRTKPAIAGPLFRLRVEPKEVSGCAQLGSGASGLPVCGCGAGIAERRLPHQRIRHAENTGLDGSPTPPITPRLVRGVSGFAYRRLTRSSCTRRRLHPPLLCHGGPGWIAGRATPSSARIRAPFLRERVRGFCEAARGHV